MYWFAPNGYIMEPTSVKVTSTFIAAYALQSLVAIASLLFFSLVCFVKADSDDEE